MILHFWNKHRLGHYLRFPKRKNQKTNCRKFLALSDLPWNDLWKWKLLKIRMLLQNSFNPISRLPRDFWVKKKSLRRLLWEEREKNLSMSDKVGFLNLKEVCECCFLILIYEFFQSITILGPYPLYIGNVFFMNAS